MAENSAKTVRRRGPGRPFQKGQSGNPGGRPKKTPLTDALRKQLEDPALADALAKSLIAKARGPRRDSVRAFDSIADRVEGKVGQPVAVTHPNMPSDDELSARIVDWLQLLAEARR
jgi:hypothetical protein